MHINCDHNECLIASTGSWRPAELGVQERRHTHTHTQKRIFLFFFFFLVIAFILGEFSDWFVRESNKRKWLDRWSVSAISCWGLFFICAHQSSNGQRLSFLSLCSFLFLFLLISSPFFIARLTRPALAVVAFERGCAALHAHLDQRRLTPYRFPITNAAVADERHTSSSSSSSSSSPSSLLARLGDGRPTIGVFGSLVLLAQTFDIIAICLNREAAS
jgi:hypothetical protein